MWALTTTTGVTIVAMANRTRERALALGRQFGVADAHLYADHRELLDKERE